MADSGEPEDESIGALLGRLADDGRAYVKAEVAVYKQIAARRAARARNGLVALAIGAVLIFSSFTALLLGLVLWLSTLIGALLAGLAVMAFLIIVGLVLVKIGIGGFKALGGDAEERAVLSRGDDQA